MLGRILNLFKKKVVIPNYDEKRPVLEYYRQKFNTRILVETGTFFGDTVEYFRKSFDFVYSIELSQELADKAINRFKNVQNVKIIQGDSGEVLNQLVKELDQPALFWLDGHYSSEFYVNDEFIRTAKADKDTPIEKELQTLMDARLAHVILIDDARLFVGQGDYPAIQEIKNIVGKSKHQYEVSVDVDIIRIIPV